MNPVRRSAARHAPAIAAWSRGVADGMLTMPPEVRATAIAADVHYLEAVDVARVLASFQEAESIVEQIWPDPRERPIEVQRVLRRRAAAATLAGRDDPSPPVPVSKGAPPRSVPKLRSGLATLSDVSLHCGSVASHFSQMRQEVIERAFDARAGFAEDPEFIRLNDAVQVVEGLRAVVTVVESHVPQWPGITVDGTEAIDVVVRRVVKASLADWAQYRREGGREITDLTDVAAWWSREIVAIERVEVPSFSALGRPGEVDHGETGTGTEGAAVAGAFARLAEARTILEMLRSEIRRVHAAALVDCDSTDARAVAREIEKRRRDDDLRLHGLWRYRVEILCGAAFLAPIAPYSAWMWITGRRYLSDIAPIVAEAGVSGPVAVIATALLLAGGLTVAARTRARASWGLRMAVGGGQVALGVATLGAMLSIPVEAPATGLQFPDRLPDGSIGLVKPTRPPLFYVRRLRHPTRDAAGREIVAEVVEIRGAFSVRKRWASESDLVEMR